MNEYHFVKLAQKSPYFFYYMHEYSGAGWILDDTTGKKWKDEFGDVHWKQSTKHNLVRTFVKLNNRQYKKFNKSDSGFGDIYFVFRLAEDSKVRMLVYSYSENYKEFWTNDICYFNVEIDISYGEYKKICKNGLLITKEKLQKWVNERIKLDKMKYEQEKLEKLAEDF